MLYKEELIRVYEEAIAVARFEAKIEARMKVALSMLESEMSYEEIHHITGDSINTLKTNYHYAVNKIKEYITEHKNSFLVIFGLKINQLSKFFPF